MKCLLCARKYLVAGMTSEKLSVNCSYILSRKVGNRIAGAVYRSSFFFRRELELRSFIVFQSNFLFFMIVSIIINILRHTARQRPLL